MKLRYFLVLVLGVVTLACGDSVAVDDDDGGEDDAASDGGGADEDAATDSSASPCGNGIVDTGETCDDGNAITEDCPYGLGCNVCNAECQEGPGVHHLCADHVKDAQEECDDGNATPGDGCEADCTLPCAHTSGASLAFLTSEGGCIWYLPTPVTFTAGRTACTASGGTLLATQTERSAVAAHSFFSGAGEVWLGLTDSLAEGTWSWDGESTPAPYTRWYPGQPDGGSQQSCTTMRADGLWQDVPCGEPRPVACEHFTCGNGKLDPGEQCDENDDVSGDGCEPDCKHTCGGPAATKNIFANGHCYAYLGFYSNGGGHRGTCLAQGGDLVTINDADEDALVRGLGGTHSVHIGAHYDVSSMSYVWYGGGAVTYSHWAPNHPKKDEYTLITGSGDVLAGAWLNVSWEFNGHGVCEFETFPGQ